MLAEAVIEGAKKLANSRGRIRMISPSGISICPRRTYNSWKRDETEEVDGLAQLRMNDGHYQEEEMLDDLTRAGFEIRCRQLEVHIAGIMKGHIDGLIKVDGEWSLIDCKAMSLERYTTFKKKGFEAEKAMKCQQQCYLYSDELQGERVTTGFIYAKHKDTCRPYDLKFELDLPFVQGIVEQVQQLIVGWVPDPVRCPLCPSCYDRLSCWGQAPLDFTAVKVTSLPEVVQNWKTGKHYEDYGKELIKEARERLVQELGDLEVVSVDDLKIQRIMSTRGSIDIEKFTQKFGAAAIADVWETKPVESIRISEVS